MAYERRNQDLKDRFTMIQGTLPFEETTRIQTALNTYYDKRNSMLPDLILQVTDTGDGAIKNSWGPKLQDTRTALDQILKSMLDGVHEPSSAALAFQGQARVEDDLFFAGLEKLKLDEARDGLLQSSAQLRDYIKVLSEKWATMTGKDQEIERQVEQLMVDLNQTVTQSIQDGASGFDRAGQAATATAQDVLNFFKDFTTAARQTIADMLKQRGDGTAVSDMNAEMWAQFLTSVFDPGKYVLSALTPTMDSDLKKFLDALADQLRAALPFTNGVFTDRINQVRALIPNQNAVLVVYSDTRKEADAFIRDHGLEVAKALFDATQRGLESWANGLAAGNQSDANTIKSEIVDRLRARIDRLADEFNQFVRDNDGKFFGPVSDDVQRQFLNSAFWDENEKKLYAWDLEAKLRQWRDGVQEFVPNVENAFGQFTSNMEDLPLPVQDAMRQAVEDAQSKFLEALKAGVENSKSTLERISDTTRTDDVRQAVDRRPLIEAMRR